MTDCCSSPGLTPIDQALPLLLSQIKAVEKTEVIHINKALGRTLANDITSTINVPPHDNSAMDGYAVNIDDLKDQPVELPLSQHIAAGHDAKPLERKTAARIFTGSTVPDVANAVIMQEQTEALDNAVRLPAKSEVKEGQNIRLAGQDIKDGDVIFKKGRVIKPQDMGLMASIGLAEVEVISKVKVAIISTGDELVEPGEPIGPHQIYNSNRYTMRGLIEKEGYEILDFGVVEDNEESVHKAFLDASEQADVVLSSGGVSVGEHDHVKQVVTQIGEINFWKLAIKPGKPLAFGFIGQTPFIGLPGNPAAVFVTFLIVAKQLLLKRQGAIVGSPLTLQLPSGFSRTKAAGRQEYFRVQVQYNDQGQASLVPYTTQSSGVLTSTSWAHGLAIIPIDTTVAEGDLLDFMLY